MTISRRAALQTAFLGGAAACASKPTRTPFSASVDDADAVFAYGVASGDPAARSVVLWTALSLAAVSRPVGADDIDVACFVGARPDLADAKLVARLTTNAARGYTVKHVAEGLDPGATYYYRFDALGARSPVGRTRTLPEGGVDQARFAVVSCSNYPFGYFNVYDQIARTDDLNAVVHLGDYLYEYGGDGYGGEAGARLGRAHEPAREILTLEDYRLRHAQYKSDPSSRAMHARHPLISIWDDHETANNSWTDGAQNHDPATEGDWDARRRAALQAYYEWMPVREPIEGRPREALFRKYAFGDLLTMTAIETRLMARSRQFEYSDIVPNLKTPEDIANFRDVVLWDQAREMLGAAQLDYLDRSFREASAAGQPWRLIANLVIMAEVIAPDLSPHVTEEQIVELEKQWDEVRAFIEFSKLGLPQNLDAWDGYPAARDRLYRKLQDTAAEGVIVLTGDTPTWWANDLARRDGAPVGVELGVSSVTSPSPFREEFLGGKGAEYALLTNRENKAIRFLSGQDHGHIELTVGREEAEARYLAVDAIESPSYNAYERAAFTIKKSDGVATFGGARGLGFKERFLF
ncbi:MAG: alkaline phosphatase D family protein [Parvularculaceae bacterium]